MIPFGFNIQKSFDVVEAVAELQIGVFAFLSLLTIVTNIVFAVLVYMENPRGVLNRLWSITIGTLVLWGCGEFIMRITPDHDLVVRDTEGKVFSRANRMLLSK